MISVLLRVQWIITCQVLKIRFQMIANISEMLIGQLQVTQRDEEEIKT
jgi:hypothetical protein